MSRILQGDSLTVARELSSESVHCIVTSPPYYGLRDYGVEGQLGGEKTPKEYVLRLSAIFGELHRVLRKDGTLWLNLGDSYAGSGKGAMGDGSVAASGKQKTNRGTVHGKFVRAGTPDGLKPKDLMGIPWRVAFALQAQGWYLRNEIIWQKPDVMPTSAKDRLTVSHETIFLFSKSRSYYFDLDAIREPYTEPMNRWGGDKLKAKGESSWDEGTGQSSYRDRDMRPNPLGRQKRDVWTVNTSSSGVEHYATYPKELIVPCVLAGCPKGGIVCDPFFGSGTTGLVAFEQAREYLGIEINPAYVALAEMRLMYAARQESFL